ncbi:penicillin-binding protein 1A [Vibrio mangrovi]|uniref:Penicillin-binding protein 1A n=1 Tax=Vibrio mangrovi TaxID=474394 RepID=A0ABU4I468_9VIBR|nr:PBP1A family penicillin-binding protein [Vibrio mangrovi]MDW6002735.1 PBP1A family penicillin-binding protein [Vibrio mangrovi]
MKFIKRLFLFSLICIVLGVSTIFGFYYYVKPELPDVATLRDVQLQTPMQVFSQDGKLIAQFGEKRRIPLKLSDIPPELIHAFLATEDSRFYEHYGFDPIGITRAALAVLISGSASQGASTITQQLARNFFLSNEKKIMRKVKEIFIAVHIEQLLTKDEILELYLNKIYLGYRSYGVGAAAQVYFGKNVQDLTLSEMAMIAGLPKAPSTMNPIYSLTRAIKRRNVVLMRMLDEHYITQEQYDTARAEPLKAKYHVAEIEVRAPYVAELARAWMVDHYGEDAYTSGMRVTTTIRSDLQEAANEAAINNLIAYDERHGYRGAEKVLWKEGQPDFTQDEMAEYLKEQPIYGEMYPAIVMDVTQQSATVWVKDQGIQIISWDGMKWARRFITDDRQGDAPTNAHEIMAAGEQIWVRQLTQEGQEQPIWHLSQVPNANTAFVAMNPENGAVLAMVGGFNFIHNKFNRVTQSIRQVGSGIKPFIYSSAIDDGMTLASLVNDAPINKWDQSQGTAWRPKNSPPTYGGPTRLRIGLAQSKNVMAIRVLREVGLERVRHYLTRFGFDPDNLPHSETIALGAGSLSPLKLVQGYSVFANGGYSVDAYYIDRVEDPFGSLEFQAEPKIVCHSQCAGQNSSALNTPDSDTSEYAANGPSDTTQSNASEQAVDDQRMNGNTLSEGTDGHRFNENDFNEHPATEQYAPQVISEQNAFLVREMMYSNIWGGGNWREGTGWNGTGWRAQKLKRRDIGGKTGTTNDSKDAWYNGFAPGIVATAWVGFDDHNRDLGRTTNNPNLDDVPISGGESGAKTAQPAWIDFMSHALNDVPQHDKVIPEHIVQARIDRDSGLLTTKTDGSAMFEYFIQGTEPKEYVQDTVTNSLYTSPNGGEELF